MKKIFTSLAILVASAVGAFAQKTVDLAFSVSRPTEMGVYPNVAVGDSFQIDINIKNNGTDAVIATDTLILWTNGFTVNTDAAAYEWMGSKLTGISIPSGSTYTYSRHYTFGNGYINGDGDTVRFIFVPNDTNQIIAEGYGYDASRTLFTDPGVDNTDPDNNLTGNNTSGVRNYILGTPSSTKNISLAKADILNVYPNPSNGVLNFEYNFTNNVSESNVKVIDFLGRVVYTKDLGKQVSGKQSFNFDLSSLSNGLYTIELYTNESRAISKFNIVK